MKDVEANQKTVDDANPKQKHNPQAGNAKKSVIAHKSISRGGENLCQLWLMCVALQVAFCLCFIISTSSAY